MIERIDSPGNVEIEEFVRSSTESLFYTSTAYMRLLSAVLSANSRWFVCRRNGMISSALPFVESAGPLGTVLNSLPFYGSNGGVIAANPESDGGAALLAEFFSYARRSNALSATIITNPVRQDAGFYESHIEDYDFRDERIGQITRLPAPHETDELDSLFHKSRMRNVRRAEKAGVSVDVRQDVQALHALHRLHTENIQALGGITKERQFFDLVATILPLERWRIYASFLDGRMIAGVLLFWYNQTVEYFTPAVDAEYRPVQPLPKAIYEAMKDASSDGYRNWNWGGTWLTQNGVYDFKKRWGAADYRYYYYTKVDSNRLTGVSKEYLLRNYRGFYVLPFEALRK